MEDFTADLSRFRSYLVEEFGDGARIPAESELADALGVTRNRIRRVLKAGEAEGLIWRHVGKGTFVGARSVADALPRLPQQISPHDVFEARLLVEPKLAALAAVRAVPSEIEEMRACVRQMRAAKGFDEWGPLDAKLHRIAAKAARNALLLAFYDTIRECQPAAVKSRIQHVYSGEPMEDVDAEHDAWVDAIADHDPEAAERRMRMHIEMVRRRLFGDI